MELINEFTPVTKNNYLLVDSWYTSAKILLHGLINGCHTIGRIKSNRVIYPAGIKTNVKSFLHTLGLMRLAQLPLVITSTMFIDMKENLMILRMQLYL